jgi:hypothetical protein
MRIYDINFAIRANLYFKYNEITYYCPSIMMAQEGGGGWLIFSSKGDAIAWRGSPVDSKTGLAKDVYIICQQNNSNQWSQIKLDEVNKYNQTRVSSTPTDYEGDIIASKFLTPEHPETDNLSIYGDGKTFWRSELAEQNIGKGISSAKMYYTGNQVDNKYAIMLDNHSSNNDVVVANLSLDSYPIVGQTAYYRLKLDQSNGDLYLVHIGLAGYAGHQNLIAKGPSSSSRIQNPGHYYAGFDLAGNLVIGGCNNTKHNLCSINGKAVPEL